MKLIRSLFSLTKIAYFYLIKKIVNSEDFSTEYNKVSKTYDLWTSKMGKHTWNIVHRRNCQNNPGSIKILDFACGTGYITGLLLEKYKDKTDIEIYAIDISPGMIDFCKNNILDKRVRVYLTEGFLFLNNQADETYNEIYCGWALCYLDHKKLFNLFNQKLKNGGTVGVIVNSQGTLEDIEDIYIETMMEYPDEINKIMNIKFNLPYNEDELEKWFAEAGFTKLKTGGGEELVYFDTPEELYNWLCNTGAGAGLGKIFKDQEMMKKVITKKIAKKRYTEGKYMINHKFVFGIFRKQRG